MSIQLLPPNSRQGAESHGGPMQWRFGNHVTARWNNLRLDAIKIKEQDNNSYRDRSFEHDCHIAYLDVWRASQGRLVI